MMRRMALPLTLLVLVPGLAKAYGVAGTVAAPYLELPMGARGEGMGEAFTGIADDINSIYYNPAGLTSLDSAQLEMMHVDSFGGIQYENIGLAVPSDLLGIDAWGTFGLSYTLVGIDDTPRTQATPTGAFDTAYAAQNYLFTAGASVVTLSYAWQATQMFSVGATVKAINEKIDTAEGWGVAGDIGLMTRPGVFGGFSAGMDLENFGTSPEPDSQLPTDLRMGAGYDFDGIFTGDEHLDKLLLDVDAIMPVVPVDQQWQLNLGAEYTRELGEAFASLRAGYRSPQMVIGTESGPSFGGGVGTHLTNVDLSLDYSWVPYGVLGSMQRIALTADFGGHVQTEMRNRMEGNYLYPPEHVKAVPQGGTALVSWDPQKGSVDGYNLYMAYDPAAKQWTRLNKSPITGTSMTVRGLYRGFKTYFCVSTLARKSLNLYRESDKSPAVVVVLPAGH